MREICTCEDYRHDYLHSIQTLNVTNFINASINDVKNRGGCLQVVMVNGNVLVIEADV